MHVVLEETFAIVWVKEADTPQTALFVHPIGDSTGQTILRIPITNTRQVFNPMCTRGTGKPKTEDHCQKEQFFHVVRRLFVLIGSGFHYPSTIITTQCVRWMALRGQLRGLSDWLVR